MHILSHGHKTPPGQASLNPELEGLRRDLAQFELGRFLLENLGLNGRWTSYILMHPDRGAQGGFSSDGSPLTKLEAWLLNRCPILLATQERFRIFRELTQPLLKPGMQLASLPAGWMDDLLTLDYSNTPGVTLTGIDLDPETLREAEENFLRTRPPVTATFENRDAWQLDATERWDLLTSNGLNIYVEADERCTGFYRSVAEALKPGGTFICSFITPPDQWRPVDSQDLDFQRLLFQEVIPVKWSCLRSEEKTRAQLEAAGFELLSVTYDKQGMFPAVKARKRKR